MERGDKVKIKELWNKIRKGVKAGMAAVTESNVLTDNRVVSMIEKFKASGKYKLMQEGGTVLSGG